MGTPETTPDASALTDSTEQMDAMDRMDDDGSPESEEAHDVAAERVEQAVEAQAERADPVLDSSAAAPIDIPRVRQTTCPRLRPQSRSTRLPQ